MTISQKLFEIFKKIKQHIVPVFFIAITVPNLNIFGAATAFQYSADLKETAKNHNFTSMCLYVIIHKKSLFQNTFFAVTFYSLSYFDK